MSRIIVKLLRRETLSVGPVKLTVYKPVDSRNVDGRKVDFIDVVAEYSERYRNDRDSVVVVSAIDEKGSIVEESAVTGKSDGYLLFPGPAKLKRIVVVRRTASNLLREEYNVEGEYYVYIGEVSGGGEGVEAVILVTDKGARPIVLTGVKKDSNGDRKAGG